MFSQKAGPIGIFDSGYGGLTVFDKIRQAMPEYDYIYLGDNARTPYGPRSFEVVYRFTRQAVMKLFSEGCQLVILACNTASAKALRTIQQRDLPDGFCTVAGVEFLIQPGESALKPAFIHGVHGREIQNGIDLCLSVIPLQCKTFVHPVYDPDHVPEIGKRLAVNHTDRILKLLLEGFLKHDRRCIGHGLCLRSAVVPLQPEQCTPAVHIGVYGCNIDQI